jgi:hypothetical protein
MVVRALAYKTIHPNLTKKITARSLCEPGATAGGHR